FAHRSSPVAGKAEEQSGSLLYTYFQGDINSMVDAHFSRALSKATKPKAELIKIKKTRKTAKTGNFPLNNIIVFMDYITITKTRNLLFPIITQFSALL
uniref:Uncharacterized protein n=1 Tax=Astyanax mexicanus TaxID=7994 RepID=A0A8B9H814_ASTMX